MLVFPQLATGAAALYPVRRTRTARTVKNVLADGRRVVYTDPDWSSRAWDLQPAGLTEVEWEAVDTLFEAAGGRRNAFTFLDPAGNLLARSEEFDAAEWDNDPLIGLTAGIDDPFGGTAAMRAVNSGAGAQAIAQTLAAPGDFRYALSVWGRAAGASAVTLFASSVGGNAERTFALGAQWKRISMPVDLADASESVTFGARLAPGAQIDLFGMQVDAQAAAGGYQRTAAIGGVHASARFAHDSLTVRAQGTDVYDLAIRIVSKRS
jgi:hypothetical protein